MFKDLQTIENRTKIAHEVEARMEKVQTELDVISGRIPSNNNFFTMSSKEKINYKTGRMMNKNDRRTFSTATNNDIVMSPSNHISTKPIFAKISK